MNKITPLLISASGFLVLLSTLLFKIYDNSQPVSLPLEINARVTQTSPVFYVRSDAEYLIEINVNGNLPLEEINCLLGISLGDSIPCKNIYSKISIIWWLSSGGRMVASGGSENEKSGAWGETISRAIGKFKAKEGKSYRLNIT